MAIRRLFVALVLLNLLVLAFVMIETRHISAQVFKKPQPANEVITKSGEDFGFRITGKQGDTLIGGLVVRVDGKWVPARVTSGPVTRVP